MHVYSYEIQLYLDHGEFPTETCGYHILPGHLRGNCHITPCILGFVTHDMTYRKTSKHICLKWH